MRTCQLLHVLCTVCLRFYATFTSFELRPHFGKADGLIEIDGARHTLSEWCALTGISEERAYYRIYHGGWTPARAVSQAVRSYPKASRRLKRSRREYGHDPKETGCRG